jgi:hypothetical protein
MIFYRKKDVENLKEFHSIQHKIDSLEVLKDSIENNILNDPNIEVQSKLNLIFNNK